MQESGLGKNDPSRRCTMGGPQALAQQKAGTAELDGLKGLSWCGGGCVHHSVLGKTLFLRVLSSCFHDVLEKDLWYLVSPESSSLMEYSDNHMKVEVLRQRFVLSEGRDTAISQTAGKKIIPFHLKIPWEIQHTTGFAVSTSVCLYSNWQCPCLVTHTRSHPSDQSLQHGKEKQSSLGVYYAAVQSHVNTRLRCNNDSEPRDGNGPLLPQAELFQLLPL